MDSLKRLAGGLDAIIDFSGRVVSWLMLGLVLLMSTDVILRYFFSIGSVWSQELEWHLLSPIVLLALGYALLHDGHLRVDVVYVYYSQRQKHVIELATAVIGVVFAALVIYLSIHYVQQSYVIDEGSPDPGGLPHRYILKAIIPLGFVLLLVRFVAEALHAIVALAGNEVQSGAAQ
jgi:TRAP-type mannitol/chloroaromatic compound transport system permease small subunit